MITLQDIGRDLEQEWRARRRRGSESYARHLRTVQSTAPMLYAVICNRRGRLDAISDLLRSDYQLTKDDQLTLAQFLDGDFDKPGKAGAPKCDERWVAMIADQFLAEWRELAKANNVSTYRRTEEMREASIAFVVAELLPKGRSVNSESVIDYMTKRGKARRN